MIGKFHISQGVNLHVSRHLYRLLPLLKWQEALTARNVAVIVEGAEATMTSREVCNARMRDLATATRLLNRVDEAGQVEARTRASKRRILRTAQL